MQIVNRVVVQPRGLRDAIKVVSILGGIGAGLVFDALVSNV